MSAPVQTPWRLDRSVNVGDLLVFLTLLASGIGYVIHQDARSTKTEVEVVSLKETDTRHDQAIKDIQTGVYRRMERIEAKLDRLIERGRQ